MDEKIRRGQCFLVKFKYQKNAIYESAKTEVELKMPIKEENAKIWSTESLFFGVIREKST